MDYRKTEPFSDDAIVTHFGAHMHLRGKSVQYLFHYPNGTSELVFDLAAFNIDWQRFYYLSDPIRVPKGTVMEAFARCDDSPRNPHNADPTQTLKWGPRTTDEMFGGSAYYTPVAAFEHPIDVVDGRRVATKAAGETEP